MHMIQKDVPLPIVMVINRILALSVIDHELIEPTLVSLYPVKPLVKIVHTQM